MAFRIYFIKIMFWGKGEWLHIADIHSIQHMVVTQVWHWFSQHGCVLNLVFKTSHLMERMDMTHVIFKVSRSLTMEIKTVVICYVISMSFILHLLVSVYQPYLDFRSFHFHSKIQSTGFPQTVTIFHIVWQVQMERTIVHHLGMSDSFLDARFLVTRAQPTNPVT